MTETKTTTTPPLAPRRIEALKPRASAYEVFDGAAPGLHVRVLPTGRKVFRWRYRVADGDKTITIAPFHPTTAAGHLTLAEARVWLDRLREARDAGEARLAAVHADLRALLAPKSATDTSDRSTFGTVVEEFYRDDIAKNRKHPLDARAIVDRDLKPLLGDRPLEEITTLECRDVIKRCIDRGAPVHAGKVLSTLKQFWNWAQANGFTERNPAAPLNRDKIGVEHNMSSRCLSAEEIPKFWRALEAAVNADRPAVQKLRPATAAAIRVLLLTATRTGELLRARWEHVDLDAGAWSIPLENQKLTKKQERAKRKRAQENGTDGSFIVPLPPLAVAEFETLKRCANGSPWVVASPDAESKLGHYDTKAFGHALRRLISAKVLVLPGGEVTPHDLRRTARTHLAKLRVPHWIVERCLNHSLGKIGETYDQHDYFEERREALDKWDAFVTRLLSPAEATVAFLPAVQR